MAPLLEELTSHTALGPKLRKLKIDVDHIVDSMEGKKVGDLINQVCSAFAASELTLVACCVRLVFGDGLPML